jgi:hypothetical protein
MVLYVIKFGKPHEWYMVNALIFKLSCVYCICGLFKPNYIILLVWYILSEFLFYSLQNKLSFYILEKTISTEF